MRMVLLFMVGVAVIADVAEGTFVLIGGSVWEKVGTRLGMSVALSTQLLKTILHSRTKELKIVNLSF